MAENETDGQCSRSAVQNEGRPGHHGKAALSSRSSSEHASERPSLPSRPKSLLHASFSRPGSSGGSLAVPAPATRSFSSSSAMLYGKATTALSLPEGQTRSSDTAPSSPSSRQFSYWGKIKSDAGETGSVMSVAPTLDAGMEGGSVLGDFFLETGNIQARLRATKGLGGDKTDTELFPPDPEFEDAFEVEFNELDDITSDGLNEEAVLNQWKSKLKQFFILSSAGKPVWSRHGDDKLISHYVGVILTLISSFESVNDTLKSFTAGNTKYVFLSKGDLHLLAISKLNESEQQLRAQLEALYMQVLSTLTLPVMERMFKARASTDLRRQLHGTDKLLSALADTFTRGAPTALLSSLEALKMRKAHRKLVDAALLRAKNDDLLYGMIVAGGRLVSVIRPRKHSLHPGDLHLVFNMLFEAGSVKAGEGENWIPLCLPAFNNAGYLHMYTSFLNLEHPTEEMKERPPTPKEKELEVAIILISARKESFFEMRQMRLDLVDDLEKNKGLDIIRNAIRPGRQRCSDFVPGTAFRHFLYKSKPNVQFLMPSFEGFSSLHSKRRLFNVYSSLHGTLHSRPVHPKLVHTTTNTYSAIAWNSPTFELYAIAQSEIPKSGLAQSASKLVQAIRKEEERFFIVGGAVF